MLNIEHILFLILAYLTGSFPSAVWVGRTFYNKDVREYGSGNAGATNTFRVLGKWAGIPVLMMDVFKGWLSVNYIFFITDGCNPFTEIATSSQFEIGKKTSSGVKPAKITSSTDVADKLYKEGTLDPTYDAKLKAYKKSN